MLAQVVGFREQALTDAALTDAALTDAALTDAALTDAALTAALTKVFILRRSMRQAHSCSPWGLDLIAPATLVCIEQL